MFRPRPRKRDERRHPRLSFEAMWPKNQEGLCRCGCGEKLTGRRKSWASEKCSGRCLEAYRIAKGDGGTIRRVLKRRDHGVCALCGLNTEEARQVCLEWLNPSEFPSPEAHALACAEKAAIRARYMTLGFPSPCDSWWHADHIQPLEEGGANSLDNLRTACVLCHRRVTRQHAARRAQRKRAGGAACLPLF